MSGNSGPLASSKGDTSTTTTSTKPTKSGFDQLDINKLFKGKTAEPTAKAVAQKHGMQTLGKVLPARRPGQASSITVKPEGEGLTTEPSTTPGNTTTDSSSLNRSQTRPENLGESQSHPPHQSGWSNSQPPPAGPPRAPNVQNQIPTIQPLQDKKWSGGVDRMNGPYGSRFAQEFPSLDAATSADPHKGSPQNLQGQGPPGHIPGPRSQVMPKPPDNQYGPGPILRPQTDWTWTQGGGAGRRPPPNQSQNFPPDRPNAGVPTPPPMSLVQGGPPPPPLGFMQFRGISNPPFMYPNSGPPMSNMRYGMPIPHDAPPPPGAPPIDRPPRMAKVVPPPRPGSHFTSKPILKQEELERMDEIGKQDGGWASTSDDIDYNKKINFSDDEMESRPGKLKETSQTSFMENKKEPVPRIEEKERKPIKILEREKKPSISEKDPEMQKQSPREREIYDSGYRGRNQTFKPFRNDEQFRRGPAPQINRQDNRQEKQQRHDDPVKPHNDSIGSKFHDERRHDDICKKDPHNHKHSEHRKSDEFSKGSVHKDPNGHGHRAQVETKKFEDPIKSSSKEPGINNNELKRVDEVGKQSGGWADEIDYNKKINFSDDESGSRPAKLKESSQTSFIESKKEPVPKIEEKERKHVKILEREKKPTIINEKELEMQKQSLREREKKPSISEKEPEMQRHSPREREKKPSISEKEPEMQKHSPREREAYDSGYRGRNRPFKTFRNDEQYRRGPAPQTNRQEKQKKPDDPVKVYKESTVSKFHDERRHEDPAKVHKESTGSKFHDERRHDDPVKAHKDKETTGSKFHEERRHDDPVKVHKESTGSKFHDERRNDDNLKKDPHNHKHSENKKSDEFSKGSLHKDPNGHGHRSQGETKKFEDPSKSLPKEPGINRLPEKEKTDDVQEKKPLRSTTSWAEEMDEDETSIDTQEQKQTKPIAKPSNSRATGGSRLQGYGPPSDRNPFSSNVANKDEAKDKLTDERHSNKPIIPPPTSGPVPLMALGDISPPDIPPRFRKNLERYDRRGSKHGSGGRDRNDHRDRGDKNEHRGERNDHGSRGGRSESFRGSNRKHPIPQKKGQTNTENESSNWSKPNGSSSANSNKFEHEQPRAPGIEKTVDSSKENILKRTPSPPQKPQSVIIGPTHPKSATSTVILDNILDSSSKVPSMVFENTKLKKSETAKHNIENSATSNVLKLQEDKSAVFSSTMDSPLDITKQLPLGFGKAPGSETSGVKLDFGSTLGDDATPVLDSSKSVFMRPSPNSYVSHQPSAVSPLTEISETIQAVRSIWENPSVTEISCPSDDSSINSGFGSDFKRSDSTSRDLGQSLQASSSLGYAPGNQNPVSVIAKPGSSASPNGGSRLNKPIPSSLDSQSNQQIPFSLFGYGMPQQNQGSNAFSGIPAIPSPPTAAVYGKTAPSTNVNALYQGYQHPEPAHLMSGNNRTQYTGYSGFGPFYMGLESSQYPTYGHQAVSNVVPQAPGAPGSNRISPSSMPITSTSSGSAVGGMMSSTGPMSNTYKVGRSTNPNLAHNVNVHHGPNQQQGYSQMTHHLAHHLGPVGHQKSAYSQSSLPQNQAQYMVFDPNQQSIMNLTQNYMSGGMRNAGPPPSATPPMQGMPSSGPFYGSNATQSGYPGGSSQTGNMQPLHVAVAPPGPPSLSGPNPHYGMQFQPNMNMPGYNSQPNGINIGNNMGRPGGPPPRK